ncbi:MAG: sigma-70 family RNA polymerase sigma factor [Ferruginibacter sp.]
MSNLESNYAGTVMQKLSPQHWVNKYADYLYCFAIGRINDEELAKDLVQETFLSALEKLDRFEGRSSEKSWLTAILKYKIIDIYRSKSSIVEYLEEGNVVDRVKDFFQQYDGHWNVEDRPAEFAIHDSNVVENKEFQSILQKCLNKLPVLWMSIFKMKFIDEELTTLICKELKITSSNYWVIIHRAKVNLRSCIQKNWI